MRQWIVSVLVQIMACRLLGARPLSKQCWVIANWALRNKLQWHFNQNKKTFHAWKCIWKYRLWNGGHFVQGEMSSYYVAIDTKYENKMVRFWWNVAQKSLLMYSFQLVFLLHQQGMNYFEKFILIPISSTKIYMTSDWLNAGAATSLLMRGIQI